MLFHARARNYFAAPRILLRDPITDTQVRIVADRWYYPIPQALQRHIGCRLPKPQAEAGLSADPAPVPTIETAEHPEPQVRLQPFRLQPCQDEAVTQD